MAREKNVGEYGSKDHQEQGGLLNLAQMLGSVSQACKMMGFDEILRVVDSMQKRKKNSLAAGAHRSPTSESSRSRSRSSIGVICNSKEGFCNVASLRLLGFELPRCAPAHRGWFLVRP
jgi:hypothetical protein